MLAEASQLCEIPNWDEIRIGNSSEENRCEKSGKCLYSSQVPFRMVPFIFSSLVIFVVNKITLSFVSFGSVCHPRLSFPFSICILTISCKKAEIFSCGIWFPVKDVVDDSAA